MKTEPSKKEQSQWWLDFRAALPGKLKAIPGKMAGWGRKNFRLEQGAAGPIIRDGLWRKNPVLVLMLGLCSALAATGTLQSAAGMAGATLAVLLCTNLVLSLIGEGLPRAVVLPVTLTLSAGFATAADLLLQVYWPEVSQNLGIFVPLIAVNGLILSRDGACGERHTPVYALLDSLATGLGFGLTLLVLGALREVLGRGTLWGVALFDHAIPPILLMAGPCGGFFALGIVAAVAQGLRNRRRKGGAAA